MFLTSRQEEAFSAAAAARALALDIMLPVGVVAPVVAPVFVDRGTKRMQRVWLCMNERVFSEVSPYERFKTARCFQESQSALTSTS